MCSHELPSVIATNIAHHSPWPQQKRTAQRNFSTALRTALGKAQHSAAQHSTALHESIQLKVEALAIIIRFTHAKIEAMSPTQDEIRDGLPTAPIKPINKLTD